MCLGRVCNSRARLPSALVIATFMPHAFRATPLIADELEAYDSRTKGIRVEPRQTRSAVPLLTHIRLVDAQSRPVADAVVAEFFERDNDLESVFKPTESAVWNTSDEHGEVSLELRSLRYLNVTGVFAIRQLKGRPLVGLQTVRYEDRGKQLTIKCIPPVACFSGSRVQDSLR